MLYKIQSFRIEQLVFIVIIREYNAALPIYF